MKTNYRPEIDGLRAIAVGGVILYHTQKSFFGYQIFPGGYLGVNIFFVISGYLITSIILNELIQTDSFSFKNFYIRRIRRILPALLFVILTSLPVAWLYLIPNSFTDYSKSIIYSLGFSSNFYFHYSGQEYGASDGLLKPFLHTWSLAVEEQFYILFPIITFITYKFFRKYLIHLFILGLIVSLILSIWLSGINPSISFYFLHTRMWELLAGSILAYFKIKYGFKSKIKVLNTILPIFGLASITFAFVFLEFSLTNITFNSLPAILGVCLIILFSEKNNFVTKFLSNKLFQFIGLISYSLYLWHYPIFAFERISEYSNNNLIKELSLGLIILVLSIATYYFIEKPFRNEKIILKKLLTIIFGFTIFLLLFCFYIIKNNGLDKRLPEIFQVKLKADSVDFYQNNNSQKVVLIGDSHTLALQYNLNEEIKKNDLSLHAFYTQTFLKDFNFINRYTKKIDNEFIINNKKINNFLKNNSNLIVVLHHRWSIRLLESYYQNDEGYKEMNNLEFESYLEPLNIKTSNLKERQRYIKEGFISQINSIINEGHQLILVYPVPEMAFSVPKQLLKKIIKQKTNKDNLIPVISESYDAYKKRNHMIIEILDNIKKPNIYRVYPDKLFCNNRLANRCVANDQDNLFYYDDDHLSLKGSELLVNEIMKIINLIINKK